MAAPAGTATLWVALPAATCRAWMRNAANIAMHIPYATNTPDANDANTAEINTIDEFTATP